MNMPPPVTRKTFLELQNYVAPIYMKVAQDAMISAANEILQTSGVDMMDIANTAISAGGFASLNGINGIR